MRLCDILRILCGGILLETQMMFAQKWYMVRENAQKSFPHTVPAGNYSGITHLHDDIYAVVSDKSDSALYFNFRIQINPRTGDLEKVENLGFTEYVDGNNYDHEAIAKVSDSTIVIASEGHYSLKEYPIVGENEQKRQPVNSKVNGLWEKVWAAEDFYPNYVFESLAFDTLHHCLWTIPESTLREDGQPATPTNGLANKLRLMRFDWRDMKRNLNDKDYLIRGDIPCVTYAYQMDKPSTNKKAETYVMGVSELCVLPDGQLLVLEREAFIPKIKLGAFCKCKLYLIDPWKYMLTSHNFVEIAMEPIIEKRLLAKWKTGLSLLGRSFANYEGMCLGPQLEDGSQVLILLADSQDQYAGVLKDCFKTIVISDKE